MVERWNSHVKTPYGGIRQDLFRFADIVAVGYHGITGTLYIQACAAGDHARRLRKLTTDEKLAPRVQKVIQAGNCVCVWSWAVRGRRGKRKLWTLKETRINAHATWSRAKVLEQVRTIAERDGDEPDGHDDAQKLPRRTLVSDEGTPAGTDGDSPA